MFGLVFIWGTGVSCRKNLWLLLTRRCFSPLDELTRTRNYLETEPVSNGINIVFTRQCVASLVVFSIDNHSVYPFVCVIV